MYFVDRNEIKQTLAYTDKLVQTFNTEMTLDSFKANLGLERTVHLLIESILDVGNMMIDGFIMRDPGSYEDIIDILIDEKVLPKQDEGIYKEVIGLRQMIVQDYLTIDHGLLKDTLVKTQTTLKQFSSHITTYLNNELGVAHAFSNDREGE